MRVIAILFLLIINIFISRNFSSKIEFSSKLVINPPFIGTGHFWVDSLMKNMTIEEKIAQCFMVDVNFNNNNINEVESIIKKYSVGGIILFKSNPSQVVSTINRLQSISKIPLLVSIDAEWGLAMRIDSTLKYPYGLMLGACCDNLLIYQMGKEIGEQLKSIGIHINFAPVADINVNPKNPVINFRSFGENAASVAEKSYYYMKGLQDAGVIAVAKHFPGHGDTYLDSHLTLPTINSDYKRIDSLELFPFKSLINEGVSGIMIAHIAIPAIDSINIPASLSEEVVESLLKKNLGYKGLIFTDAMNMGGITNYYKPIDANIMAFKAGNDIILMPSQIQQTIQKIKNEIKEGKISEEEINEKCYKILSAKYWVGLNNYKPIKLTEVKKNLNKRDYEITIKNIVSKSIVLLKNNDDILPLENKFNKSKIAIVNIGSESNTKFQEYFNYYYNLSNYSIDISGDLKKIGETIKLLKENYDIIVLYVNELSQLPSKNFGITLSMINLVDKIIEKDSLKAKVITIFATNPYAMNLFKNLVYSDALILTFEDNEYTQLEVVNAIIGASSFQGKLPITIKNFNYGSGITTKENKYILKLGSPEECKINREKLNEIDSIIYNAINVKAFPGCQVLAARNGIVFYYKSFGKHEYTGNNKVTNKDIYDLASLTKVLATTPAIMHLYEKKLINLNDPISKYLKFLDTTDKKDIKIYEILIHQSGLKSWIPFYLNTLEPMIEGENLWSSQYSEKYCLKLDQNFYVNKNLKYKNGYYSTTKSENYPIEVSERLYLNKNFIDTIYLSIAKSNLEKKVYRYSDLGFILLYKIIEEVTKTKFEVFIDSFLYKPIGAWSLCFNPLKKFNKNIIVPTENDIVFRKQLVHGYVHDMAAALMGGVSGHAGLFGNAFDVAKVMQVVLNYGKYCNIKFFEKQTVEYFTSCVACKNGNRRGLGFDKPHISNQQSGIYSTKVSLKSYGHTGFTGTMVWADPQTGLLFVFLSNRIYPDMSNNKINELAVRTKIHDILYKAME